MATTKRTPHQPPAGSTLVKIDKQLKRRWEQQLKRFEDNRTHELAGWDEMHEALGEILESTPLPGRWVQARRPPPC